MDNRIIKYLQDIHIAISEIEQATEERGKNFNLFLSDFVYRKFIERELEIMGEAMNRILKIDPAIPISAARKIVDTRNFVIHSYDSLLPEILWAIVINHLPLLHQEVSVLLSQSNRIQP